ncbi:MAG: cupin domain-containing protein [Planctomycetes bacterium]|nr:cupin domain-containing protein [Planctomycetota bacterium]
MIIKQQGQVQPVPVEMAGAVGAKLQVLLGPADKAPTMAMRIFELAPSGHTPFHKHAFEHEVMILDGDIAVVTPEGDIPVKPGDVMLVLPEEMHQFKNCSDTGAARFMCLVPIAYQA